MGSLRPPLCRARRNEPMTAALIYFFTKYRVTLGRAKFSRNLERDRGLSEGPMKVSVFVLGIAILVASFLSITLLATQAPAQQIQLFSKQTAFPIRAVPIQTS
jgi:hypothetical protein